ncbi:MAG: aminotransferase class I/II-fold pyridoxal phosphate-dependent enzyme [Sediminicola sp.]
MTHYIDSFPGPELLVNGEPFLYFGGTAYLGLQTDPNFQDIMIGHIKKYGTNYGASRNSNLRISVYGRAEEYLSYLVGSESCLTLSSGYLAGQAVSQFFANGNYALFHAPNAHPALQLPTTRSYGSYPSLQADLLDHIRSNSKKRPVLFLDSVDFSGLNHPSFEELKKLPLEKIILVIDDSHAIGILGNDGAGTYRNLLQLGALETIVSTSLGKGFGIQAGAIFGSWERLKGIRDSSFFGGASPAAAAHLATLLDATSIFGQKRTILRANMAYFQSHYSIMPLFTTLRDHPTYSFHNSDLATFLETNHILFTHFPYPRPDSPMMGRIVLSAHHTKEQIDRLTGCIQQFLRAAQDRI